MCRSFALLKYLHERLQIPMAPWIASVGADNAIQLRHRELHQNTYWHITTFPCLRLEAAIANEHRAMEPHVCYKVSRGRGAGPGAFKYEACPVQVGGRRVAQGGS